MKIRRVEIADILAARDARVERQNDFLRKYPHPIVSLTMNIAGPVKLDEAIFYAFREGVRRVEAACGDAICAKAETAEFTGCEAIWSVALPAEELKARMTQIEQQDALGRLFDLDVLDVSGQKLTREETNRRRCLLCGKPAYECARARAHSVEALSARTHAIIRAFEVGKTAERALLCEAECAPKPGLVDPLDAGAHHDMNIDTFRASAHALRTYFEECARIGAEMNGAADETVFGTIRKAGIAAKTDMLRATGGVNTHKGAIFSLGLLSCAAGMTDDREEILRHAAAMAAVSLRELQSMRAEAAVTAGEKQYFAYGFTGVRGQAAAGFPDAVQYALPALENTEKSLNDAGLDALLRLMAHVNDSNLLRRGGEAGLRYAQSRAAALLEAGYTRDDLVRLNADFKAKNLSPGGSADLLAVAYFLHFLSDPYKGG